MYIIPGLLPSSLTGLMYLSTVPNSTKLFLLDPTNCANNGFWEAHKHGQENDCHLLLSFFNDISDMLRIYFRICTHLSGLDVSNQKMLLLCLPTQMVPTNVVV